MTKMLIVSPRLKYFLCTGQCVELKDLYKYPDSHIIGNLKYVSDEGRRVTALARWEISTCASDVPPVDPFIDMEIIGDVRNIRCRHPQCYRVQRWEIGKAAFMALMQRYMPEETEEKKIVV